MTSPRTQLKTEKVSEANPHTKTVQQVTDKFMEFKLREYTAQMGNKKWERYSVKNGKITYLNKASNTKEKVPLDSEIAAVKGLKRKTIDFLYSLRTFDSFLKNPYELKMYLNDTLGYDYTIHKNDSFRAALDNKIVELGNKGLRVL